MKMRLLRLFLTFSFLAVSLNACVDSSSGVIISALNTADHSHGLKLEPYTDVTLRPGRLTFDSEIKRRGSSSIRLHIFPGDCGTPWPPMKGGWSDCRNGNERIGINEERKRTGKWFYTASLFLDSETFRLNSTTQSHVNLLQWLDQNTENGPPFNIKYFWQKSTAGYLGGIAQPNNALIVDINSRRWELPDPNGDLLMWSPYRVLGAGSEVLGRWLDIATYANWTSSTSGFFIMSINDKIVFDYRGPTLDPGSSGVVYDAQIYRYGAEKIGKAVTGTTEMVMNVDSMGVSRTRDDLANAFPHFARSLDLLTAQEKIRGIMEFNPELQRYDGCRGITLC